MGGFCGKYSAVMPKIFTEAQVQKYHEAGYVFPLSVLSEAEVTRYLRDLDRYLEIARGALKGGTRGEEGALEVDAQTPESKEGPIW